MNESSESGWVDTQEDAWDAGRQPQYTPTQSSWIGYKLDSFDH